MRQTRFSILVLLAMLLVACGRPATPALTPSPTPPQATLVPAFSPMLPTPATTGPSGVDVAMKLVKIPDQKNIAVVEGETITTAAYQDELNRALIMVTSQYQVDWNAPENQEPLPQLQQQVLDQMVDRIALRKLAGKEGVTIDSKDIETEIASVKARVLASGQFADWATFVKQNGLTEEVVHSMVSDNLLFEAMAKRHSGSTTVEQVHASHILVATQETGQEVLDKLAKGGVFDDLAKEYSTDPGSKVLGGDLGWFPRGVMVPEFEQVAFSLEPGKISPLVKTDFGYHIILVKEKAMRELAPDLAEQVQQKQFQTWFEEQRGKLNIERLYTFSTVK